MVALQALAVLAVLPTVLAHHEETLGVFIFHRHGDRTSKAHAPTRLTELGQHQVLTAGEYFRDKYVTSDYPIHQVSQEVVVNSQINVEAPVDVVLQNSAQAFLQGLYPPVKDTVGTQMLANGTKVFAPLNLIPVNQVSSAIKIESDIDPENVHFLQNISGCDAAITSSKKYYESEEFKTLEASTKDFYQRLVPVINGTFDADYASFKNAYSIYDLINVAVINNKTIPSSELLDNDTLFQLRTLADKQQFGLAYSKEEPERAISGRELAAQIVQHLDEVIFSKSASKIGIQFGAYATFLSFFGAAQLPSVSDDFTGVVDYASSMTFEMFTEKDVTQGYPDIEDINIRFLFSNGSASYMGQKAYPLFGQGSEVLPYSTFKSEMYKFAISTAQEWCEICGADSCPSYSSSDVKMAQQSNLGGMSLYAAGVIGAFVTMVFVLGVQSLIMFFGGMRVVSKKRMEERAAAAALAAKEAQFA